MPCIHTTGATNNQRPCKPAHGSPFICQHRGLAHASHTVRCAIQWIDEVGNPTPDYNEAIGVAYIAAHPETIAGNVQKVEKSAHFPICEAHRARMSERGMEHWRFIPLAQYTPPEDP